MILSQLFLHADRTHYTVSPTAGPLRDEVEYLLVPKLLHFCWQHGLFSTVGVDPFPPPTSIFVPAPPEGSKQRLPCPEWRTHSDTSAGSANKIGNAEHLPQVH